MKKWLLPLLCFFTAALYAQDSTRTKNLSNVERFMVKKGAIVQVERVKLGAVPGLSVSTQVAKDVETGYKAKGISFIMYEYNTLGGILDVWNCVIDEDEIDGALETLRYIKSSNFKYHPDATFVEVTYNTRGDFEIGCYSEDGKWFIFVQVDEIHQKRVDILNDKHFNELVRLITLGRDMLKKM